MKIIYSDMKVTDKFDFSNSIFLAGPTPRKKEVKSWRPEAIRILEKQDIFDTIFVPERSGNVTKFNYDDQVEWEFTCMHNCSIVMMWLPRHLPDMPAFTSNIEFGLFLKDDRFIYGRPDDAEKCDYLDWAYGKYRSHKPANTLLDTIKEAETLLWELRF